MDAAGELILPGPRGERDDPAQSARRRRFLAAYPQTAMSSGTGFRQATTFAPGGINVITRPALDELMDELERRYPAPGGLGWGDFRGI
jgi:hypothetical protein